MSDEDSFDKLIPLLPEFEGENDKFDELGRQFKMKAVNDGALRKLRKARNCSLLTY